MPSDGQVPDGWRVVRLGDVAGVTMGQSPPGAMVLDWDGNTCDAEGLPFIQGNAEFGAKFPTPLKWCIRPLKVAEPDDILISVRAPVGQTNRSRETIGIGRGLAAIRFAEFPKNFGWHVVNHAKEALERVTQGSTFQAIGGEQLRNLRVPSPPLLEQRAIAGVLDAIDEAIERTEAVIGATERLRDSLLHELLTRGVPGWHSEWKEVAGVGTVPACWEVVRLGEVCNVTSGLAMGPHRIPRKNSKPYLTVANVQADRVTTGDLRLMELTEAEYSSRVLLAGDVVLVEGHAQISQLGRAALVPPEADGYTFQNHLFRVRSGERCKAVFVCAYVNGHSGRRYFGSFGGTTSGLNTVSAASVKALPIPVPPIKEQCSIATVLGAVDEAIEGARQERDGLAVVKTSAADALLTGRVRVPPAVVSENQ